MRYKSPLATYENVTANHSGRRPGGVDGIVIHHMASVMTAKRCADMFASSSRQASSNYTIGYEGDCALSVPEDCIAWTTSSWSVDSHMVTIEVSNSSIGGQWPISDAAYRTLIDLCVDICKANGFRLNYTGNSTGNLVKHRWYAPTGCPGDYLDALFTKIAADVNARLDGNEEDDLQPVTNEGGAVYRLYNTINGTHMFTTSKDEASAILKQKDHGVRVWNDEGVAWTAPKGGTVPIYRLFNTKTGEHMWTASFDEAKHLVETRWGVYEGVPFFGNVSGTPIYRLYNSQANIHHFTASESERDNLVKVKWNYEGIAFYGA